jgi:hypothetical protein
MPGEGNLTLVDAGEARSNMAEAALGQVKKLVDLRQQTVNW